MIAATSLPPIPWRRQPSHSSRDRSSVSTSTCGPGLPFVITDPDMTTPSFLPNMDDLPFWSYGSSNTAYRHFYRHPAYQDIFLFVSSMFSWPSFSAFPLWQSPLSTYTLSSKPYWHLGNKKGTTSSLLKPAVHEFHSWTKVIPIILKGTPPWNQKTSIYRIKHSDTTGA